MKRRIIKTSSVWKIQFLYNNNWYSYLTPCRTLRGAREFLKELENESQENEILIEE